MLALAAASRPSAANISGRWFKMSEGKPVGIVGGMGMSSNVRPLLIGLLIVK